MAKTPVLRLLRECKLADLVAPPRSGAVFEASGVITNGSDCFVVLDNVRRVVRIAAHLRPESGDHEWVGAARQGEGYEAVTFGRGTRRFYLMIEAQKHPDGTFKGAIEEYDKRWRFKTTSRQFRTPSSQRKIPKMTPKRLNTPKMAPK